MRTATDWDSIIRGRHLSYQRGRRNTHPETSLIKIEGVDDTAAAKYVLPNDHRTRAYGLLTRDLASTSARRSPMSTGARRRSAAPRSA